MSEFKLLLDVDGVLNASKAGWSRAPKSGYAFALGQSWRMRWEPEVMKQITALHKHPSVEVLWATTWVEHTEQLERLFRLPALLSAASKSMDWSQKAEAALRYARQGFKVIWVDDEAIPSSGPVHEELLNLGALFVVPKSNKGLQPAHFELINAFVTKTLDSIPRLD